MSKELVPTESSKSEAEKVPLATQRAHDGFMKRFGSMLDELATLIMRQRNSATLTEADYDDAFRQLTRHNSPTRLQRAMGDGLLVIGGIFIPLWPTSPLLTVGGVVMGLAGLYVREFMSPKYAATPGFQTVPLPAINLTLSVRPCLAIIQGHRSTQERRHGQWRRSTVWPTAES